MERGSDRVALITGQIQTLPASSSSSSDPTTHREDTDLPSQAFISHDQEPQSHVPDQIPVFTPEIEEEEGFDFPDNGERTNTEEVSRDTNFQVQPPLFLSTVRRASSSLSSLSEQLRIFSPTRMSSAIEAMESSRSYIPVAVAFLVVLAHLAFPLLGSKMVKTLLGFRPLYLVLLTNVALVLTRILAGGRPRPSAMTERLGESEMPIADGYEWADRLGRTLQAGLVMKKVLDAMFMDCAVYAVIVVCGLSFAQQLH